MIRTFAVPAFAGIAMTLSAVGTSAATMTLDNWTFGNGNDVHASSPADNGHARGFTGTLSGSALGLDGPIDSYCVELTESFSFGHAYATYHVVTATDYFGASEAATLGTLVSYVFGTDRSGATATGCKDDLSTSLQLAIWNVVYDTDILLTSNEVPEPASAALVAAAVAGLALMRRCPA